MSKALGKQNDKGNYLKSRSSGKTIDLYRKVRTSMVKQHLPI